jgi:hypothetical protein
LKLSRIAALTLLCAVFGPRAFAQAGRAAAEGVVATESRAAMSSQGDSSSTERTPAPFDSRAQYPRFLSDSFVGVDVGSINYPFSSRQLEPGFTAQSIDVPHAAARVVLYGHRFNKFFSAQLDYTRPVKWVNYRNLNGTDESHTVWMAVGDALFRAQAPISSRFAVYGEGGLGVVNRIGFEIGNATAVSHANFATPVYGAGVEYHVNPRWDLVAGATYVPEHEEKKQPGIGVGTMGFRYNLRPLTPERIEETRHAGNIFPANLVQVAFTTNVVGYGANDAVSSKVPVFWGGNVRVARGVTLRYQRNLFHTASQFSIDVGVSASLLKTNDVGENFAALSVYPVLRWTFLRRQAADVFFSYTLAGPSYLTKQLIDGQDTGNNFTFQDIMGFGMFVSRKRNVFVQLDISHYSNGNLFSKNPGVRIPTTIAIGRAF